MQPRPWMIAAALGTALLLGGCGADESAAPGASASPTKAGKSTKKPTPKPTTKRKPSPKPSATPLPADYADVSGVLRATTVSTGSASVVCPWLDSGGRRFGFVLIPPAGQVLTDGVPDVAYAYLGAGNPLRDIGVDLAGASSPRLVKPGESLRVKGRLIERDSTDLRRSFPGACRDSANNYNPTDFVIAIDKGSATKR